MATTSHIAIPLLTLLALIPGCTRSARMTAVGASIPEPTTEAMPDAGTYRIRWLPDHAHPITAHVPGIRMGSGQRPSRAWVQVDYQGPKERLQLVAVNTVAGEEREPIVFYDEKFGAAELEISGSNARYFRGEAFRRPRQTVVLDLFALRECADTALASVFTFDSVDRAFHHSVQEQFYMAAFDAKHRTGKASYGEGPPAPHPSTYPGPTEISDNDATTLLYIRLENAATEIQLRFR